VACGWCGAGEAPEVNNAACGRPWRKAPNGPAPLYAEPLGELSEEYRDLLLALEVVVGNRVYAY